MRPSTRTGLLVALLAVMFVAAIVLAVRMQAAPAQDNTARPAKQGAPPAR